MIRIIVTCILFSLCSCAKNMNYAQIQTIAELPKSLQENSGMVMLNEHSIWVLEDSGNKDELYEINLDGEITRAVKIKKAKNVDWEDLTKDKANNVYIGDFGNNKNKRKDLTIYVIPNLDAVEDDEVKAEKITFEYPEQEKFPYKHKRLYDCEAFFYYNDYLYLFTKDRSDPYRGMSLLYKVPAQPGDYKAELIGGYRFSGNYHTGSITAATISKDEKRVVLLTHSVVYIFEEFEGDQFFSGKMETIDLGHESQKEAIVFKDAHTLIIGEESEKGEHPLLYKLSLDK